MTRLAVAALLASTLSVVAANNFVLEIIELNHRLPRDVLPVVEPLVTPGGSVSTADNKLIVRSSPSNISELRRVLAALDTPLKQLRITVTQDRNSTATREAQSVSGQIGSGDVSGRIRQGRQRHDGAQIEYRNERSSVRYRHFGTRENDDGRHSHFVLTMDGQAAFIETGQDIPLPYSGIAHTPYGTTIEEGISYENVSSGFYVTPRVHGDQVRLEIAPRLERLRSDQGGAIDSQRSDVVVTGKFGEWIPLAGTNATVGQENSRILGHSRRRGENRYDVWVKVEEVR